MQLQPKSLKKTKMKKPSEVFSKIRSSTMQEDLRKWFDKDHPEGGWKRINSKGEAIGPCAREPGEPKPKCMSNEKRAKLSKKERAAAVATKRKHDPNPERKGEPINVSNFGKGKISEDMENLEEKNVPTSPEKWAQAKAQAKANFDVYPSAYANGWAAKKYKEMGGGWKSVSEQSELGESKDMKAMRIIKDIYKRKSVKEEVKDKFDIGEYDQEGDMAKSDLRSIMANAKRVHDMLEDSDNLPEWVQSKITLAEDYISTVANYMTSEMSEEVEQVEESFTMGEKVPNKQGGHNQDVHHNGKKIGHIESYSHRTGIKYGMEHHASGEGTAGSRSHEEALSDLKAAHKEHMNEEVKQMNESGGDVVYKKGEHHIEKYGEDVFALYKNGKKQKNYTSVQAAKSAISEDVEQLDELMGKGQLPKIAAYHKQKGDEAKGKMETIRNTNRQVPVPKEKSAKIYAKDAESTYHYTQAKRAKALMAKEEVEQVEEGKMKDIATNREEDKRLGSWRKETPWMKVKSTVTDKSGAKHTPMSRARDLARAAAKKNVKESVSITESRLADIVREAAEKAKKKKKEETRKSDDTFQAEPELSSQIIRND